MVGRSLAAQLVKAIATVTTLSVTAVALAITWPSYLAGEQQAIGEAEAVATRLSGQLQFAAAETLLTSGNGAPARAKLLAAAERVLDERSRAGRETYAVTDQDGRVLAAADAALVGRPVADVRLSEPAWRELRSTGHALGDWRGQPSLVVRETIVLPGVERNWTLYLATPASIALADARNMAVVTLLFGFIAMLVTTLVAWRLGVALSQPVTAMAAAMRRMADGDLEVPTPTAHRTTELGDMARALETFRATARERLEAEAARRAAEKTAQDRSDFLAVMSHEIRTPMNGVLGMADALSRTSLSGDQRKMLQVLGSSGDTLLRLLNDVLDASKIDAGGVQFAVRPFDIGEAVSDAGEVFRKDAEAKGLELFLHGPAEACLVLGDAVRVRQAVHHLVSNAVKFTHAGTVSVEVSAGRLDSGHAAVRVRVSDTGVGITPDVQARLFHKFEQGDASATRAYGGAGLGLSIARDLARQMNGDVTVESEPGVGSSFSLALQLPLAEPESQAGRHAADGAGGLRVLVAEDNPNNRQVLELILGMVDADVTFAENGAEAVAQFGGACWDVVLMDVQMPVMDGLQATRAIRQLEGAEGRARTPVIAVTANAMPHHVEECLLAGMDAHVAKPVSAETLFSAISGLAAEEAEPAAEAA